MDKIYVVFWTQGGNTQAMAEAIGEGIREAGKEAEVVFVTGADIEALKAAPKFALGCPAMGAEVREEAEYLQMVTNLKTLKRILNSGFDCYPEAQEQILRFVREHRDLTRRSWAKRADRIKVEPLMKGRGLFYLIYTLAEMKNNPAV